MIAKYRELWKYREMILGLTNRDLKGRYKESVLGFFWMLLNPLFQLCIYNLVFSVILRMDVEKYYLFLFVALIPWIFFSTCLSSGTMVVISQQDLVKKIYFPREVLPFSFSFSQFLNFFLSMMVAVFVSLLGGTKPGLSSFLWLAAVMFIQFVLCYGCVLFLSAVTVYLRDMEHIMQVISMAWMYLTPILYPETMVPEGLRTLYMMNPVTPLVIAYRDILYYGKSPDVRWMLVSLGTAMAVLLFGHLVFARLQRRFAEEL